MFGHQTIPGDDDALGVELVQLSLVRLGQCLQDGGDGPLKLNKARGQRLTSASNWDNPPVPIRLALKFSIRAGVNGGDDGEKSLTWSRQP